MSHADVQQTLLCTLSDCFWPSLSPEIEQSNRSRSIPPSMSPLCSTQTTCFTSSSSPIFTFRRPEHPDQPSAHYKEMKSESVKLRCWNHNCNGRTFSSLGNYRRHIREKSGNAKTFLCQNCGRLFTRSTALNSHHQNQKCPAIKPKSDMLSCMSSPSQFQSTTGSSMSSMQWSDVSLPSNGNLDLKALNEGALQVCPHGEVNTSLNQTLRPWIGFG
jgi:hypothetical protein